MKEKYVIKECKHHGETEYILEARGAYRCKKCRSNSVTKRRQIVKAKLVNEFGGKCKICSYNKCIGALEFHHINRNEKSFALSYQGATRSYQKTLEEAKKCILVCSNCHREIEAGLIKIDK
jgi:hypothetical protein